MIHLPRTHRSYVYVQDVDLLEKDHHVFYWRAAYNYYVQYGAGEVGGAGQGLTDVEAKERIWNTIREEDEMALEYFGECRERVKGSGYCVLPSFLDDKSLPERMLKSGGGILCQK